jgi:hypothetical protein
MVEVEVEVEMLNKEEMRPETDILSDFDVQEEFQTFRIWLSVLRKSLEENDKELAQNSIKEIISVISQISFIYNLWPSITEGGNRNVRSISRVFG